MSFLIRMALLAAAVAAGVSLAMRKPDAPDTESEKVVYLGDDEAVVDPERPPVAATVKSCIRRMDPLTLNAANEAVFILEDGSEVKLNFAGEGGLHMKSGDHGLLAWRGMRLIRFEMDNGDVVGGMFYAPAGEESADE